MQITFERFLDLITTALAIFFCLLAFGMFMTEALRFPA